MSAGTLGDPHSLRKSVLLPCITKVPDFRTLSVLLGHFPGAIRLPLRALQGEGDCSTVIVLGRDLPLDADGDLYLRPLPPLHH